MIDKYLEPYLNVEIISPTKEQTEEYFKETGDMKFIASSKNSITLFKKAIIKGTFDPELYPVGSEWMMGESPGIKGSYFGEAILLIQTKDLYRRVK